jgi:hypothetical protein
MQAFIDARRLHSQSPPISQSQSPAIWGLKSPQLLDFQEPAARSLAIILFLLDWDGGRDAAATLH